MAHNSAERRCFADPGPTSSSYVNLMSFWMCGKSTHVPSVTMLATASSSASLVVRAPVFLHVGAEAGKMALDWTIRMEKEEPPFGI